MKKYRESMGKVFLDKLAEIETWTDGKKANLKDVLSTNKLDAINAAINLGRKYGLKKDAALGIVCDESVGCLPSIVIGALLIGAPINWIKSSVSELDLYDAWAIIDPKLIICSEEALAKVREVVKLNRSASPVLPLTYNVGALSLLQNCEGNNTFVAPDLGDLDKVIAGYVYDEDSLKCVPIAQSVLLEQWNSSQEPGTKSKSVISPFLNWFAKISMLLHGLHEKEPHKPRILDDHEDVIQVLKEDRTSKLFRINPNHLINFYRKFAKLNEADYEGRILEFSVPNYFKKLINEIKLSCRTVKLVNTFEIDQILVPISRNGVVDEEDFKVEIKKTDEESKVGEIVVHTIGEQRQERRIETVYLGCFEEDNLLTVLDKKEHIFNYHNIPIRPSQIEEVLLKIEGVLIAIVVGFQVDKKDSIPVALIIPDLNSKVTEEEIYGAVRSNLPQELWIRGGVYFVTEMQIPLTSSSSASWGSSISKKIIKEFIEHGMIKKQRC